jgi:transcriptional regulator with XRE-family HTH domain
MVRGVWCEQNVRMQQFGINLRRRARELDLTDAEVARRAGISERRYGFYVTGDREPDLATLVRIAEVLQATVDRLLRPWEEGAASKAERLMERIRSSAAGLPEDRLHLLAEVAETFVEHDAPSKRAIKAKRFARAESGATSDIGSGPNHSRKKSMKTVT